MHGDDNPTESTPRSRSDATIRQERSADIPTHLGPYHLRQKIGEGGMGEVWLAEQSRPIQRKVALKIIKRGMDSKEVVARFAAEKQALALMNHPCVAKVLDVGTTPSGRPYFVMEYVPGLPITEYCDRHEMGLRDRLELFQRVCEGVQHAHHKAIIHRDLKPSNVLVMEQDGNPSPKIIDFGVAKATSQKLTEQTMFTQLGVLIGTPEYMSPEQAELTGEDVDTRTDVYSLGVILYELLVGALPFEPTRLREAGFDGIRRIIRQESPPRPSIRLSTLGEVSTASARVRRMAVSTLRSRLRGDLDWITMKALEKDRGRRYASPADLSRDIERHLTSLPVEARAPTLVYRAGRFVKRNRIGVTFATAITVIVLGAAAALAVLYTRSVESERRAEREASTSREALEFMTGLFRASDPFRRGGTMPTARELLDSGAERLAELDQQPEVQIRLMGTIGDVYRELGSWDQSREILEAALRRQTAISGARHPTVAKLQYDLGYNEILAENYARAEELLMESLETRRELLGEDSKEVADTRHLLAFSRVRDERYAEAEPESRKAMDFLLRKTPDAFREKADFLMVLGWSLWGQGKIEEARRTYEECLQLRVQHLGYENPATGWTLNHLGKLLVREDDERDIREGIARLEEALAINEKLFDGYHVEIAFNKTNIAEGYLALGQHEIAESYARAAVEMASNFLGDRGYLAAMKRRLARCLLAQRRYEEAEQVLLEHHSKLQEFENAVDERREAEELLSSVYSAWGRPEAIETWRQRNRSID